MNTHTDLAQPELADIEVIGTTRGAFLVRGALAAGAVYGASTVAPFVSQALAADGGGDADILNFALTLEYLETAFYKKAQTLSLSSKTKALAKQFGAQEAQHVAALTKAISGAGASPVMSPKFSFPITDEKSFLKLAVTLEDTGVSAYNGAAPSIQSTAVLAAAGSIVQIEARHAAAIRNAAGKFPTISAFDKPLDKAAVLAAVKPLIKA